MCPYDQDELLPLQFPTLKVLDLNDSLSEFPHWMVVPPTLKLHSRYFQIGVPSVSQLSFDHVEACWIELDHLKCPLLQVLKFEVHEVYNFTDRLLNLLRSRRKFVEAGLEVEGGKMQALKKLVINFERITFSQLEECRELVEEVVDWKSEPDFWGFEI